MDQSAFCLNFTVCKVYSLNHLQDTRHCYLLTFFLFYLKLLIKEKKNKKKKPTSSSGPNILHDILIFHSPLFPPPRLGTRRVSTAGEGWRQLQQSHQCQSGCSSPVSPGTGTSPHLIPFSSTPELGHGINPQKTLLSRN